MSASLDPCTRPSPGPWALGCCGVRTRQPVHCARPRCRSSEAGIGRRRLARPRGPGDSGASDTAPRPGGADLRAVRRVRQQLGGWRVGPAGRPCAADGGGVSWLVFGALTAAEVAVRAGLVGLPVDAGASGVVWILVADVDDALLLFGLARLADMVAQVNATQGELADLAVSRERLRAAAVLRSAVGERLTAVSGRAAAALQVLAGSPARARVVIAAPRAITRQALAASRTTTPHHPGP